MSVPRTVRRYTTFHRPPLHRAARTVTSRTASARTLRLRTVAAALGALSLSLVSPTLSAQGRPVDTVATSGGLATPGAIARDASAFARRIGLWASAGGGRGSAGLQCASCTADNSSAFMAHFAVGGQPHPRFHVGVEAWMWLDVIGDGVDRTARGTQIIARHYPMADRRLFVVGGVGTSRFRVDDGEAPFHASSPALSIGLGWDVPFRGVILSPALHLVSSTGGALRSDRTGNSVADDARLGLWRSTIAITWF